MKRVLALGWVWFLFSCATVRVFSDAQEGVDFARFKTFDVAPYQYSESAPVLFNEMNYRRLKSAITQEMQNRGYRQLGDKPDLMISVYLKVAEKQKIIDSPSTYGGGYYYGYYSGYNRGWVHTVDYQEGTLIIDLVDTSRNQLVWQGVAKGTMAEVPKDVEVKIQRVVNKIFTKYPHHASN